MRFVMRLYLAPAEWSSCMRICDVLLIRTPDGTDDTSDEVDARYRAGMRRSPVGMLGLMSSASFMVNLKSMTPSKTLR